MSWTNEKRERERDVRKRKFRRQKQQKYHRRQEIFKISGHCIHTQTHSRLDPELQIAHTAHEYSGIIWLKGGSAFSVMCSECLETQTTVAHVRVLEWEEWVGGILTGRWSSDKAVHAILFLYKRLRRE